LEGKCHGLDSGCGAAVGACALHPCCPLSHGMRKACHGCKEDGAVLLLGKGLGCCREFVVGPCWSMVSADEAQELLWAQDMLMGACEWAGRGPGP